MLFGGRFSHKQDQVEWIFEIALSILVFVIILFYSYAWFFFIPYDGFNYSPLSGEISNVYIEVSGKENLRVGDVIIRVGKTTFEENLGDRRVILLPDIDAGEIVPIRVERNGKPVDLLWQVPGVNPRELNFRLVSSWWVPFVLWFAGMITILQIRPRDSRRYILAFSYFLTAIWLAAGLVSQYHLFYSSYVLHAGLWMSAPLAWHLAWSFPKTLYRPPHFFWFFLYGIFFGVVIFDTAGKLPDLSYALAGLMGVLGSLAIMFFRVVTQPGQRRAMGQMVSALALVSIPMAGLAVANLINPAMKSSSIFLIPIALIPLIHIYSIYRRRLGEMEVRINRAMGFLTFAVIIFMSSATLMTVLTSFNISFEWALTSGVLVSLFLGVISAVYYPVFQRWFEIRVLGIRPPPQRVIEEYAGQIATSLELNHLIGLIRDEILPGFLVRQAALLRIHWNSLGNELETLDLIFSIGITKAQIPELEALPALIQQAGVFRRPDSKSPQKFPYRWVKLILKLALRGQVIGVLLLGKRDPDDTYSVNEIPTLQALMDQTALALANIDQANLLHSLYQNDISRVEAESSRLVHELHDDVLSEMALLAQSVDQEAAGEHFLQAYHNAVQNIRNIISGIRPTTLDQFGLEIALEELLDSLLLRAEYSGGPTPAINLELSADSARYPGDVELNVYRIVQQASLNAIAHANASQITIHGCLEDEYIELDVVDDGAGFLYGEGMDLGSLLVKKHFGLVAMRERATLIHADLQIKSEIDHGTRIKLIWNNRGN